MLYYASKLIRNQGKKGIQQMIDSSMNEKEDDNEKESDEKKENNEKKGEKKRSKKRNKGWDFELKDVYVVALMNFKLPNKEYPDHSFLHKVQLMDVDDLRVFYEKLTLVYVELPKLDDVELDLNTPLGRWLYALNSLYYYDQKPEELKEPVFDKLFRQAELALLTPDQDLAYERSMKVYLDTYNQLKGARILGQREGMAKGEKLGLEKGKKLGLEKGKELGLAEAKRETAKRMLNLGFDLETIRKVTGLTQEEIEK